MTVPYTYDSAVLGSDIGGGPNLVTEPTGGDDRT